MNNKKIEEIKKYLLILCSQLVREKAAALFFTQHDQQDKIWS